MAIMACPISNKNSDFTHFGVVHFLYRSQTLVLIVFPAVLLHIISLDSQKMAASPPFLLAPAPHPTNAMALNIPSQIFDTRIPFLLNKQ